MVSILILTKNEERDLPDCLASVGWSDDVHVLDSCSTDRTAEVATASGARVRTRAFDNYAAQRNAGLHESPFKHDWVLLLDADERVPKALAAEITERLPQVGDDTAAFRIRRRDFWMDTWLRHAQISPFYVRLVRPRRVRYEREVNEVLVADGPIEELREPFDHYPFSKGLRHWIDKHNRYSSMEAEQVLRTRAPSGDPLSLRKALLNRDFNVRRLHQKGLFYKMPFRPLVKFGYMMLARRAFLDGRAGIAYAFLQSIYEYMIVLKTRELEAERKHCRADSSVPQQAR